MSALSRMSYEEEMALTEQVAALTAENATLRAAVSQAKFDANHDLGVLHAERDVLRAEVDESRAKLELVTVAGQEVGNQWRILHEHYQSVNAEVARYRTMLREVVPERDKLREQATDGWDQARSNNAATLAALNELHAAQSHGHDLEDQNSGLLDGMKRLEAKLVDAGALYLADEQSVRNMEKRIEALKDDNSILHSALAATRVELSRIIQERESLEQLRTYVNPLPILGCECGACVYLRRKQDEERAVFLHVRLSDAKETP
jgi:SMC interacting uncharacterized protein involved in chromosome segregation